MNAMAFWIDNDSYSDNPDGSYNKPYRTIEEARNGVKLDYPNPIGIYYNRENGQIIGFEPENLSNNYCFTQYVGLSFDV